MTKLERQIASDFIKDLPLFIDKIGFNEPSLAVDTVDFTYVGTVNGNLKSIEYKHTSEYYDHMITFAAHSILTIGEVRVHLRKKYWKEINKQLTKFKFGNNISMGRDGLIQYSALTDIKLRLELNSQNKYIL